MRLESIVNKYLARMIDILIVSQTIKLQLMLSS